LFADQGQQQQLQVVGGQFASARQAAIVGKAEAARTSAAAMVAAGTAGAAMSVVRCEFGMLIVVLMLVAEMMVMMVVVMMMGMMVRHDRFLYIVRYIVRYTSTLIVSTIECTVALHLATQHSGEKDVDGMGTPGVDDAPGSRG
jgi:hypothetical protein